MQAAFPAAGGGSSENFGDQTIGADEFPCNTDRALASPFTIAHAGTVSSMFGHFSASTTSGANVRYCIFTDSAGAPGSLVGSTGTAAVPAGAGWVECTGSIVIPSSGTYWLVMVTDSFQPSMTHDVAGLGDTMVMANGTFSYATPPSTWPGTDATYDGQANIYGTLNF
jgi:hypothetical protein